MIIKAEKMFVSIAAIATFMCCIGVKLICELLPLEKNYEVSDIFGVIFMCVWTTIAGIMGISAFVMGTKKIIINENGVLSKTLISEKMLKWAEIKDYGLSYCGKSKSGWTSENTYYLYFSKDNQKVQNECKKKLKGKMIKVTVKGDSYGDVIEKVFPFCKEKLGVEPFIGEDKVHIL